MSTEEFDQVELEIIREALLRCGAPKELREKLERIAEHKKDVRIGRPSKHPLQSVDVLRATAVEALGQFEPDINQVERMELLIQIANTLKTTSRTTEHLNESADFIGIPVEKLTLLITSFSDAFPDRDLQSSISRGRATISKYDQSPSLRKK